MDLWIIVALVVALGVLTYFFAADSRDGLDNIASNRVAFDRDNDVRPRPLPLTPARKGRFIMHPHSITATFPASRADDQSVTSTPVERTRAPRAAAGSHAALSHSPLLAARSLD